MKSIPFTECVDLVGSRCKPFNGTKKYVSTGAVDVDQINEAGIEIIDYEKRPSRANLEASLGDVLFAKMQGTKKTLLINSSLVENIYSTGFCAVKAKKSVLTERCLYHLLTSKMFLEQKDKNCSGATQKAITNKGLQKVILHVPDINKQDLIAAQLDLIVKIITLRKQELTSLDYLIKARFVEMFGHQSHNEKSLPYMTIDDVAEIYLGITHTPTYVDSGVIFISAKNTSGDFLDLSDVKYISREEFEGAPKGSKPKANDVLFSRVGSNLGHPVILEEELELCTFVSLGFLRSKGTVTSNYLKHWMRDEFFARQVSEHVKGGGQPNLNTGWLKEFKIIVPDMDQQKKFDAFCCQIDKSKLLSGCRLFHSWAPENRDKPKHVGVPRRKTKVLRGGRRQQ